MTKVEEQADGTLLVHGLATAEKPDQVNEVCDYLKSKPYFIALGEKYLKISTAIEGLPADVQSMFPAREMHQLYAAGCGKSIEFDDEAKTIHVSAHIVDKSTCEKVRNKVLIGFSQGGDFMPWDNGKYLVDDPVYPGCKRYISNPAEISLVDNPCLEEALIDSVRALKGREFLYVKADGSRRLEKFKIAEPEDVPRETSGPAKAEGMMKWNDGKGLTRGNLGLTKDAGSILVLDTDSAVRFAYGRLLQKSVAAGFGDAIEEVRAHVVDLWKEKVSKTPPPTTKDLESLVKYHLERNLKKGMWTVAEFAGIVDTMAWLQRNIECEREYEGDSSQVPEDLIAILRDLTTAFLDYSEEQVKELISALEGVEGEKAMTPQEIQKAQETLAKAKDHMKALATVLGKAMETHKAMADEHDKACKAHETMGEAHKELTKLHKAHAGHLEKAMESCKALGAEEGDEGKGGKGGEESEGEKAAKAAELAKNAPAPAPAAQPQAGLTAEQITEQIKKGIEAGLEDLRKSVEDPTKRAALFAVPRDNSNSVVKVAQNDLKNSTGI